MDYGYFNDLNKEYIITTPMTPVKWINYIGQLSFGGFIDNTGGSLICKKDPSLNRIVKYFAQLPASDFKGETMYIRYKEESEDYKFFSPYFVPTLNKYEKYECHVGLGYSRYITEFNEILSDITVFIPMNESRMIRDIKITNKSGKTIDLDLIPVIEYTHFDALKQLTNADWVPQTMQSRIYPEKDGKKILIQYAFMNRDTKINYFTSNHPVSSFESDRKRFLGNNEYGSWANPVALNNIELDNYEANRGDNIGAILHHFGKIKPGESIRLITQLGQEENINKAIDGINKYRNENVVDDAFRNLKLFWEDYLSMMRVETPDPDMNTMLNIHNPRQCYTTKNWSRYLSLYQLGFGGDRGMGFRDSSQDVMGIMGNVPEEGLDLIRKLLHVQRKNGSAMHQFNPLTMVGTVGDSKEYADRPKYYSDDHLWIVLAVCSYLKETGNLDFLKEVIPYYEKDKNDKPIESGTALDHLMRAIDFTKNDVGMHGLPHAGFADWNDTVNLKTGAESVFTADLYGKALIEIIELMEYLGDSDSKKLYISYYEEMKEIVNKNAWDGEWYTRYFDFDGSPLGSKINQYGKIYINSQSWAVISGFANADRAKKALNSVNKLLNTKNGLKLSYPGFNGYDSLKGGISTYPPGAKENGGIFLHTNPWVMIAETIAGNGDRAYQYYSQINPATKNKKLDEYECEPYCYPQNILGDEHPQFGLARNSWLSGTASWVYQAATKYILGIMPSYKGLKIDPCIPRNWENFKVKRHFRNSTYDIEVRNPDHISKGVKSVIVDGKENSGSIIPDFKDNKIHKIEIILGL